MLSSKVQDMLFIDVVSLPSHTFYLFTFKHAPLILKGDVASIFPAFPVYICTEWRQWIQSTQLCLHCTALRNEDVFEKKFISWVWHGIKNYLSNIPIRRSKISNLVLQALKLEPAFQISCKILKLGTLSERPLLSGWRNGFISVIKFLPIFNCYRLHSIQTDIQAFCTKFENSFPFIWKYIVVIFNIPFKMLKEFKHFVLLFILCSERRSEKQAW